MRPVDKMQAPVPGAFNHHNDARGELVARLGRFCSYCERMVPSAIHVEHIRPKSLNPPAVADTWANYLLSCANCNSCKLAKNIALADVLLPDRDNTFKAFDMDGDGALRVHPGVVGLAALQAQATLDLFQLGSRVRDLRDLNGNLIADDRIDDRLNALAQGLVAWITWFENPTAAQMNGIVDSALSTGYFSMWMHAFEDVPTIRQEFIKAFTGTDAGCFDPATTLPIAANRTVVPGLADSGKI